MGWRRGYLVIKRVADVILSLIMIILFTPLFLVVFFIVLFDTKGFPVFRQLRIGKNNKKFLILKFRTMNVNTPKDVPTHLLINSNQYITKFGKFLRKTSLDETPQFFNVFIGQMSLIGPRPALWNQDDLINLRTINKSNLIRPGITGWAQINGRDSISIEEKAILDKYYYDNCGFGIDCKILLLTLTRVISKKDVIDGKQS